MKLFAFTMDLEPDYAGLINEYNILKDHAKIEELLSALASLDVKITAFTVGSIFERFPEVIEIFEKYNCEFEPHSYSHNFNQPDSDYEIRKAREAYETYFKRAPQGYRAPRGKISRSGIDNLERQGFSYDSSIFPSFFPNPFRYLLCKREAHYFANSNVLEIPITSMSPFRVTLSISYIKLLGLNYFKLFALSDVICFDSHLSDLIIKEDSFNKIPLIWRLVYSRNKFNGFELCIKFLEYVKQKGYTFCYMSEIYNLYRK